MLRSKLLNNFEYSEKIRADVTVVNILEASCTYNSVFFFRSHDSRNRHMHVTSQEIQPARIASIVAFFYQSVKSVSEWPIAVGEKFY